jgi:hypothetical protein
MVDLPWLESVFSSFAALIAASLAGGALLQGECQFDFRAVDAGSSGARAAEPGRM